MLFCCDIEAYCTHVLLYWGLKGGDAERIGQIMSVEIELIATLNQWLVVNSCVPNCTLPRGNNWISIFFSSGPVQFHNTLQFPFLAYQWYFVSDAIDLCKMHIRLDSFVLFSIIVINGRSPHTHPGDTGNQFYNIALFAAPIEAPDRYCKGVVISVMGKLQKNFLKLF